jgi:phosphatidylinositol alpha-1,6-mannosyltransferase
MRLLIFSSEFPPGPGGIGSHAFQIAANLHSLGWEVAVLSPQDYSTDEEVKAFNRAQPFTLARLKHRSPPPLEALYRLIILRAWVKSWQPDILMASGEKAVWLAAVLARVQPYCWVAVGHGFEFGVQTSWRRYLNRRAFSAASGVICVSNYTRSRMLDMDVVPRYETVIPNGADRGVFHVLDPKQVDAFRHRLGLEQVPLLLTVGNVTERKGQDIVIRALPHILKSVPEVHYLVVGLPTRKEALTELARELGVAERVHFAGKVTLPTLVEAYNACDIYVMTSRHAQSGDFEGYGIAAVEAALCAKPAVVSSGSGLEEAIVAGQTGLTVPENDPEATAGALNKLLSDPVYRERLGRQARQRALQEQTWDTRSRRYDQFLRDIILGYST